MDVELIEGCKDDPPNYSRKLKICITNKDTGFNEIR